MTFWRVPDEPQMPQPGELLLVDFGDGTPPVRCIVSTEGPTGAGNWRTLTGWIDPEV